MLEGEVALYLEVFPDALDNLKSEIVERGASGNEERRVRNCLGRRAGDEVLGGFLIAVVDLKPLITAQVISNPGLAALVLASDPVAEQLALVGVALALDRLPST